MNNWSEKIKIFGQALKIAQIRKRILITLLIFVFFRLIAHLSVP